MERDELISEFSQHEVETAESLLACQKEPATTDLFRRMLLLFLRGHYSSPSNYLEMDQLACYVWTPDSKTSTLVVDYTHGIDDRKPDNYPGVYIGFGQTAFEKLVLGNFAGNTQDMSGRHVAKESVANFEISHVAKRASDAYDLAELTSQVLTAMAEPLCRNVGATGFEVMGMALPKEKKPSPDKYYTVATAVQIKYIMAVTRTIESHRIRRITMLIPSA